ncbi:complement regulator-acquiring protein [Borreliella lusitaniae]|uniref:complement regulator-acquiring protein n=1 Tax=Borreliella lusitaniae TaxID=100177 RepID=UPI0026471AB4|nr:complement regulator-acquiring protein [Borreliella lusitaniae]WKC84947.1 complement regulator-acquiring protein [Borreliella lusitaniae]
MNIKSLIRLKCAVALLLSSCTVDANLNEDYKNKVGELLKSTADGKETVSINTGSNTNKQAELEKQTNLAKNKKLQIPNHQANPINLPKDSKNIPKIKLGVKPGKPAPNATAQQAKPLNPAASTSTPSRVKPLKPAAPNATAQQARPLKPAANATQQAKPLKPAANATTQQAKPLKPAPTPPKVKPSSRGIIKTSGKKNGKNALMNAFNQSTNQTNLQSNNSSLMFNQAQPSFVQASSKIQAAKDNLLRAISEQQNKIKNNTFRETHNQFKMRDTAFTLLDVISNISSFNRGYAPQLSSNTQEAQNERNKFYAMMDFDQFKTEQFGSIMEILYQDNQNHDLIRSLIISGLGIEISFELALEELEKKLEIFNQEYLKSQINGFEFETKIKELDLKLNTILSKRKEWSRSVESLIANTSSNANLKDPSALAQYIQARNYSDNMQNAREAVLESYIRITELK